MSVTVLEIQSDKFTMPEASRVVDRKLRTLLMWIEEVHILQGWVVVGEFEVVWPLFVVCVFV